jgi:hypothetical protein
MRALYFVAGFKAQCDDGDVRILLGDSTRYGAIMLQPIQFLYAEV